MDREPKIFLSDLSFVLSLFCTVLAPMYACRLLGSDGVWSMSLADGATVWEVLGVPIFGATAATHAWTSMPMDFVSLCAWPGFSWASTAFILKLSLSLKGRAAALTWGLVLAKFAVMGAMAFVYAPQAGWTPVLALGALPAACALVAGAACAYFPQVKRWQFATLAGVLLSAQLVMPWFWLLFV